MHFCKKFSFFTHINFCEKKEHRAFTFHTFDQPIYHPNVDLCKSFGTFLSCVHRNQTVSHLWSVWIDISLAQKAPFQPSITFKSGWLCKCSVFTYFKFYYYTSDSLWKIWLVESIQSIHNSLWTWHDRCNICCRYCMYHVKFNVCLVTKALGVFSSETE